MVMGGGSGVPSGRVSPGMAISALCNRASPTCAKILAPAVQLCHDFILASHWRSSQPHFPAFLPKTPGLGVFLKVEVGLWLVPPL